MSKIFINYRQEDAVGYAGRLRDYLARHFGDERIFFDEHIGGGERWEALIRAEASSCAAMVVFIGPTWLTATTTDGTPRLHADVDYVRLEIEIALQNHRPVLPVFMDTGAPDAADLPPSISGLTGRQGVSMHRNSFSRDAAAVAEELRKLTRRRDTPRWWVAAAAGVGIAVGLGGGVAGGLALDLDGRRAGLARDLAAEQARAAELTRDNTSLSEEVASLEAARGALAVDVERLKNDVLRTERERDTARGELIREYDALLNRFDNLTVDIRQVCKLYEERRDDGRDFGHVGVLLKLNWCDDVDAVLVAK